MADRLARRGREGMVSRRGWDPFERMEALIGRDPLEDLRRVLGAVAPLVAEAEAFVPDFEVRETKDAYDFRADLPGVNENDIDLTLTEGRLTVSGRREEERREERDRYFVQERRYGTFSRTFALPADANTDDVQAEFRNGVLTLRIPKRAEAQARRIPLGGGAGQRAQGQAGPGQAGPAKGGPGKAGRK
jgi:HSP20 family protein